MAEVKAIIIPLGDYATRLEVTEILEQLETLAFHHTPVYQPSLDSDEWIGGFTLVSLNQLDEFTAERTRLAGF